MIKLNGYTVDFKKFPNNESFADMIYDYPSVEKDNIILFKFEGDEEIFHLTCVKDFVDNNWPTKACHLVMPYIPYSRMDRQEEKRLFTLKTFAKIINSMNFASVTVMEPHSEVSVALIDKVKVVNKSAELALEAMRDVLGLTGSAWFQPSYGYEEKVSELSFNLEGLLGLAEVDGVYLVYPDAGAEKRYRKQIKYGKVLTCSKDRDFNTGKINSIVVNGADKAQDCKIAIIVDDLSSRGGTFIGAASAIRAAIPNIEKIILCVTHCENTIFDGTVLSGTEIDKVYTTNSIITEPSYTEVLNFDRNKLVVKKVF